MAYIKRNPEGHIIAVSKVVLEGFEPLQFADMTELIKSVEKALEALSQTDLEFIRVIEDLVILLVDQSHIRFTDLPEPAQRKILERQRMRDIIRPHLNLLPDEDHDKLI